MPSKNLQSQLKNEPKPKHFIFAMIFKVNQNSTFKKETNICSYIVTMVINMLIFLTSKEINLFSRSSLEFTPIVYITMFGLTGFILVEFLICLIYQIQFYLGIQFKIIRYVILPAGMIFLLNKAGQSLLFILLGILFALLVGGMSVLFQSQSYSEWQINPNHVPLSSYFIILELLFYLTQSVNESQLAMLLVSIMMICSFIIKLSLFSHQLNDHLEFKFLSINAFLYCVYAVIIFLSQMSHSANTKALLIFIIPLIIYYAVSQLINQKVVPISFKKIFTLDTLTFEQFVLYAEYLIEEAFLFNQAVHSNFCDSLIFTFYSQHERYCQKPSCKFFSQNWKEQFKNSSDPKTAKKLVQKVIRKLQSLFDQVHKNQPDNIQLKLAFVKFYISTLPNKIRVLQLISELQNMNLTIFHQYQIYKLKTLSQKMDNIEVIDNLKTDDQVKQFQRIAYLTINSMMEFWMHFTQEKIDLPKVTSSSKRLLNYQKQMQIQWNKNKNQQKFSTLKITHLYSHYLKYVLHDDHQANILEFSSRALEQKLLHKKEIKYLSFGSESALIGASVTDDNMGKVVIVNNQASNVFGYQKNQFSKIRLNDIMPRLYAQQHDHYLLQFHKHKYKRINSDERSVYGKDKQGYLIPIILQLQRTISSLSEQLLVIANIKKPKLRQTPLICITDEEGQITDFSSGFKDLFYQKKNKSQKKKDIPTKNIQEIISNFFENDHVQDCGKLKFFEKYFTQKYGQIPIEFEVAPISFPLKPNGGFAVLGSRQIPQNMPNTSLLSLTKQIDTRTTNQGIEINRVLYNQVKNRYQIDSHKRMIYRNKDQYRDTYTIPYINIHDMTNILAFRKDEKNFGDRIRTVRLTSNGALIRVEENETFQSQDMSETEKVNRFDFKLKQWKQQYLHNKNNLLFITIARLFIIIVVLTLGLIWILEFDLLRAQTEQRYSLLQEARFRFQVRGYLSEYILSFNGLSSSLNNSYFLNKISTVRDTLVDVIDGSSIEQQKKQPILKTIYLQNQADLKSFITSDTLSFSIPDRADIANIIELWIAYLVIFSLLIVCQSIIKFLHSQKMNGVFNVFLGVDEKIIKKSYDSCYKFSLMLEEKDGQERKSPNKNEEFDEQNENPVSRMKKYKQDSSINVIMLIKYYSSLALIIFFCVIIYIMLQQDLKDFNKQIDIFNRVEGLFPESSIALMNSYFKSYKKQNISISETFNSTYQTMDTEILQFLNEHEGMFEPSFFETLMNNACLSTADSLPQQYASLCPTFHQSVFVTGIDKVTNHLAISIQNLNNNIQSQSNMDKKFFDIFQLQYDFYVPILKNISNTVHKEMINMVENFQQKYQIYMGIITLIVIINSFYIYQIFLNQIKQQIQLTKQLLYLIPDNLIDDKNAKRKIKLSDSYQSLDED